MFLNNFFKKYKSRVIILVVFAAARLVVFLTFWQASADKGGWRNFYGSAQSALPALAMRFHEICDWHPPLYYFFTSAILYFFHSQWFIYLAQMFLAALTLFIGYKIAHLFFNKKIATAAVFMLAIEPFWAWNNWLLTSENLSTPLLLSGLYYFFRPIKYSGFSFKDIAASAVFLGLATLTRPNTLPLAIFLSVLLLCVFALKDKLKIASLARIDFKKLLIFFAIFNAVFFAVLIPWMIHNKAVYGRFTLANILSTNIYYYNYPTLLAWQKNISQGDAQKIVYEQAGKDLGRNVGDQGNCMAFSKDELNSQFDYYENESKIQVLSDFASYIEMHLFRAIPFFFQPGYSDMVLAYTGQYDKPDITMGILQGNFFAIKNFFSTINFNLVLYMIGVLFWALCSFSAFAACVYSYFKDKEKFLFLFFSLAIILYNALVISPFVLARYRLPVYILFFIPLAYMMFVIFSKSKHETK